MKDNNGYRANISYTTSKWVRIKSIDAAPASCRGLAKANGRPVPSTAKLWIAQVHVSTSYPTSAGITWPATNSLVVKAAAEVSTSQGVSDSFVTGCNSAITDTLDSEGQINGAAQAVLTLTPSNSDGVITMVAVGVATPNEPHPAPGPISVTTPSPLQTAAPATS